MATKSQNVSTHANDRSLARRASKRLKRKIVALALDTLTRTVSKRQFIKSAPNAEAEVGWEAQPQHSYTVIPISHFGSSSTNVCASAHS